MNWLQIINDSIDYIEDHIDEDITLHQLASRYYVSDYHFSRVYQIICGVGFADYLRKRRLSLSAIDVINNKSILDVALKYGYQSHEAFSKAFKKFHGVTPKEARQQDNVLKHYSRLSFHITKKGDTKMDYQIKRDQGFVFLGKSMRITKGKKQLQEKLPKLWEKTMGNKGFDKLKQYASKKRPVGIVYDINPDTEEFSYLVGVEVEQPIQVDSYDTVVIEPTTFVGFKSRATSTNELHKIKQDIYMNWINDNKFDFIPVAELELYSSKEDSEDIYQFEYWISIEMK
jgi:AraC family transcriptional regulator